MYSFELQSLGEGGIAPCKKCVNPSPTPYPLNTLLNKAFDAENYLFYGFEPFAHPELVTLLSSPELSKVTRLGIMTDGGALASPQNAAGVLSSGVRVFEIVLRGGDALTHEGITARPGLFNAALKGIANLKRSAAEQNIEIFITGLAEICRHNEHALIEIVRCFVEAGVDAIRVHTNRALNESLIDAAYEIAIPAGVYLFGDYCTHIDAARLYELIEEGSADVAR